LPGGAGSFFEVARCRDYHPVKAAQLDRLVRHQKKRDCVSDKLLFLRQPEVRLGPALLGRFADTRNIDQEIDEVLNVMRAVRFRLVIEGS
jgi:hypothetical protein